MKKINAFANVLMCVSLGLWAIKALLDYSNNTRHIELFATNGWFWYDDVLLWGNCIIPIIAVCWIAKFLVCKKIKG